MLEKKQCKEWMNSNPGLRSEDTALIETKKKSLTPSYIRVSPLPLGTEASRFLQKVCLMSQWLRVVTASSCITRLCFICYSEFGGGPRRLAPLLPPAALLGASAQFHGALVWGRGGHQHGTADSPQLRGESAETVLLVGHRLLLHYLPSFRHLLEHLCLRAAGGADTTSTLMKDPL